MSTMKASQVIETLNISCSTFYNKYLLSKSVYARSRL